METSHNLELKQARYHEAAHAVVMWNLDLAIEKVVVNRYKLTGYVHLLSSDQEVWTTHRYICFVLAALAGGYAHICFENETDGSSIDSSVEDIELALKTLSSFGTIRQGAEFYLLRVFLSYAKTIVSIRDVQLQIREVVLLLEKTDCLWPRKLYSRLKALPFSKAARVACRKMALQIEEELPNHLLEANSLAPTIVASPVYTRFATIYSKINVKFDGQ